MKNILKYTLLFFFLANITFVKAQYKIEVKIKGIENKAIQFGYYYADKQFVLNVDTADAKGKFTFSGKEKLPRGLYMIILENKMYLDVLISDDQEFTLECDTIDLTKSMKVKGSEENAYFYEFQQEIIEPVQERAKLAERMYELPKENDSVAIMQKRIDEISKFTETAWVKYTEKAGNSFLTNLLTAFNSEPEFIYNENHFFEHINFADSGLVRSPVINRACKLVLARNLNAKKPIHFLKREMTHLLQKAEANQEVFAYVFTHFLNFYHSFQRDGVNEMFVYLYDEYIAKGKTPWFNETALEQIKNQADIFRYSLVGSTAYQVDLESMNGEFIALHSLDFDRTFVFFWSTGCGHCEVASEYLRDFVKENTKIDLAVYSVYVKTDKKAWHEFQEKYGSMDWINVWDPTNKTQFKQHYYISSTPIMYVLDRNKKIIDKLIGDGPIKKYLEKVKK